MQITILSSFYVTVDIVFDNVMMSFVFIFIWLPERILVAT